MRIGLLNNLRAGRSEAQVGRLLHFLSDYPDVAHVETSCAGAVPEALAELAGQDVELLVLNGGDGTIQHALTEILGHREFEGRVPWIAALRGGRTNMNALDIGTQRDPVKAMAALIEAQRQGRLAERLVRRRVLRVEYGPRRRLYGMFFGIGVIHRAIQLVHRSFPAGRSQGVFGATVVTGALLSRAALGMGDRAGVLSSDKVQLLVDGEPAAEGEYRLLMACSLERLFARMRPFWGEGPGGVRFTSIAAQAPDLWRTIPGLLAGRPGEGVIEERGYRSENVERLDLRMDCGFTVDGELVGPEESQRASVTAGDRVCFVRA